MEKTEFNLREYLDLKSIKKEQMDWDYFNALYFLYITTKNRAEKDDSFETMLRLLIHFFTKTIMSYRHSLGASADLEDMDAVVAETLFKCCLQFNKEKSDNFGNYVTASIKRELGKEYKRSLPVHVNARHYMSKKGEYDEPVFKTVAIMTENEALALGLNCAAVNRLDAEVTAAMTRVQGKLYDSIEQAVEAKEYSDKLFRIIHETENGDLLLNVYGVYYDALTDSFLFGPKTTYKTMGQQMGKNTSAVVYLAHKAAKAVCEQYSDLYDEYVEVVTKQK